MGGFYTGVLLEGGYIEINVTKKIKIYAYSNGYSDSAGSTGKNLIIQKKDWTQYQDYATVETNSNGTKYELVTLEPGKYKLKASTYYVSFDEWEYEIIA